MRSRLTAAVLLALAAVAAPAAAAERQIASGSVSYVSAAGGWVTWISYQGYGNDPLRTYLHAGRRTAVEDPYYQFLGTDSDRRGVGLIRREGSSLYERLLPDGPEVTRRTGPDVALASYDVTHGDYIWGLYGKGVFLQPAGSTRLRRVSDVKPGGVTITGRVMTNLVTNAEGNDVLLAATRARPRRWGVIALADSSDGTDGWRTGTIRRIGNVTSDGPYVYWVEHTYQSGVSGTGVFRVLRVDLTREQPAVEAFTAPREIVELAVTQGRILYSGTAGRDLFEYRRAPFAPTGEALPMLDG
ncbi:MAG TPA: hypothetical protein VJT75_09165 [Thermoleophilaceae bacterium]|nr:hypothetical protein [Thermoleophilaceae bacterium]